MNRCPRCNSPKPHLHPAVQFEGEVQTCPHEFHLTPTPQNTPAYIAEVEALRKAQAFEHLTDLQINLLLESAAARIEDAEADVAEDIRRALGEITRLRNTRPSAGPDEGLADGLAACKWPSDGQFTLVDEPGEHDPCFVVMPDGSMLALNHDARPDVDIARAKFIIAACNAALRRPQPSAPEVARHQDEYHEDMGPVLWWHFPVEEAPYVGSTLDVSFDWDWYTHWTPLPGTPAPPAEENGK